jgi:formylmethanofuran dehydrogenase subunit E
MVELPDDLKALKRFHGHLGPYVVVGFRMGVLARSKLKGRLKAVSFSGSKTPLSCIIDGVQFSSQCTMGKGNITVTEAEDAKVQFMDDKNLMEISLLEDVKEIIDTSMGRETEEELALKVFEEKETNLFRVTTVDRSPLATRVKLR